MSKLTSGRKNISISRSPSALIFYGYYDQTDIFLKMAKVLSMNTKPLDNALEYKRRFDVPYFTPDYFFGSGKSKGDALQKGDSIQ